MLSKSRSLALTLIAGVALCAVNSAAAQMPGDACDKENAVARSGGPQDLDQHHLMVCDGSQWHLILDWDRVTGRSLLQIGEDPGLCELQKTGRIRYTSASDSWEYCDGTDWSALSANLLDDLGDVAVGVPGESDVLTYDSDSGRWIAAPSGGSDINALNDIGDVTVPVPGSGDVLTWNGSEWIADSAAGAQLWSDSGSGYIEYTLADTGVKIQGTAATAAAMFELGMIDDVNAAAPSNNQVLTYDNGSGMWIAANTQGDNLGNHIATQNVRLSGNWLSNDGDNEGIRIDNAGNVGIGTGAPDEKLHVDGNLKVSGNGIQSLHGAAPRVVFNETDTTKIWVLGLDSSRLWVREDGTSGDVERFTIRPGGNVGIGTTNPSDPLHVVGDMRFTGTLNAGSVPWARLTDHPTITAGTGLTGGGVLNASRTLNLDTSYADGRYVNKTGDTMSGNLDITQGTTSSHIQRGADQGFRFTTDASGNFITSFSNPAATKNFYIDQDTADRSIILRTGGAQRALINSTGLTVNGNLTVTGTFPGDNLGNHTATQALSMGANAVTGSSWSIGPRTGSHGSVNISGGSTTYAGINFTDVTGNGGVLMVNKTADIQGFWQNGGPGWSWYFQNGALTSGTVPWARLTGHPTITAGDGLSGGGALNATRTLSVDSTVVRTTGDQTIGGTKTFSASTHFSNGYLYLNNGTWSQIQAAQSLVLRTGGGNNRLAITAAGNVGIGTISPSEKLHVAGGDLRMDNNFNVEWGGNNTWITGSNASASLVFGTSNIQRAVINNAGLTVVGHVNISDFLRVGTTASAPGNSNTNTGAVLNPNGGVNSSTASSLAALFNRNSDGHVVQFRRSGTNVGSVGVNTTNASFNTSSDRRLKENIEATERGLKDIMAIPVYDFNFIRTPENRVNGFIAQEVHEVYPEAVHVGGDNIHEDPWSVDYGRLTPLLVRAVQELKGEKDAEIEALKADNAAMRAENAALKHSIKALEGAVERLDAGFEKLKEEQAATRLREAGKDARILTLRAELNASQMAAMEALNAVQPVLELGREYQQLKEAYAESRQEVVDMLSQVKAMRAREGGTCGLKPIDFEPLKRLKGAGPPQEAWPGTFRPSGLSGREPAAGAR